MPTSRTYGDGCGIARALDVVGERWALLVVRELLLGPQRFSDLRHALPNASSNLIADRLHELEDRDVVARRRLPPPAGSAVYELTEWGQQLEPIVLALGEWGTRAPFPSGPITLSASSAVIALRSFARPDRSKPPLTIDLQLDDRAWTARASAGRLRVRSGAPGRSDVVVRSDPVSFADTFGNPGALTTAVAEGRIVATGDVPALRRLLRTVRIPSPVGVR
ncbi:MAG: winged helix-turn-helix transcriptional regulator [Jatrophihabitans sp.]